MSVVTCKVYDDKYVISADSITVRGSTQSKGDNHKSVKLKEVNGLVIGGVGKAEETSLLYIFAATTKPAFATEDSLLSFWGEFSSWKNKKIGDASINNNYIIGFGDKVFNIEGWFINEINDYEAIGAGMDYALAALYMGKSSDESVSVACELSIYCEKPIIKIEKKKLGLK